MLQIVKIEEQNCREKVKIYKLTSKLTHGQMDRAYSWVSRDVTSFAQISVRHVGVPRVSNLC